MSLVQYDTKMLYQRGGYWYYQRRVPKKYAHIRDDSFSWRKTDDDAVYIDISDEYAGLVKKFGGT